MRPQDNVWTVKETFKLPSDHIEFARLVYRSPAICPQVTSAAPTPLTSRAARELAHSDDEHSSRSRSGLVSGSSQPRRGGSPRPNSSIGGSAAAGTTSPARLRRGEIDGATRHKSDSLAAFVSADEGTSSEEPNHSPSASPRAQTSQIPSPRHSPRRLRRMSIGGGSSNSITAIVHHSTASGTSGSANNAAPASSSSAVPHMTLASTGSSSSFPSLGTVRIDSTVLWADFLEATHLVASCPLFKPKDPLDTIQLAGLHFYIFSLQSPPSESSSRKEKAKSHGTTGGRDGTPERQSSTTTSGTHSVHIEESPALSKLYRKSLRKNVGAFFPMRLMSATKLPNLEDGIWAAYVEFVSRKYSIEDAMLEYTRIFSLWKYSGVRLFFDVKRDFSAILSPKSAILALNEDGIAVFKSSKENELIALYSYTNIAHWTVVGNVLALEVLADDAAAPGTSGAALPADTMSANASSTSSINITQQGGANPNSARTLSQPSYLGPCTTVMFGSSQIETISSIMQFYIDRLAQIVFERADSLRSEPSPRIFLQTDIGQPEPLSPYPQHRLTADSLGPALRSLRDERSENSGPTSSTSDSDRENPASSFIFHSLSADTLHMNSANRKGTSPGAGTNSGGPPTLSSSPVLGRKRSPSLPRPFGEQRLEHHIPRYSDHSEEGFTSEDGPRRTNSKTKRVPASHTSHRSISARQSDTESRGSESDRDRLVSSHGLLHTEGSESDFFQSRPESPAPNYHLASSTSSVDHPPSAFTMDTSTSESTAL